METGSRIVNDLLRDCVTTLVRILTVSNSFNVSSRKRNIEESPAMIWKLCLETSLTSLTEERLS